MAGNTSTPGASVIGRALALLGAFDARHRRLTLAELARRADLPEPTAHRQVRELVAGGALDREPDGRYVVGRLLWNLGLLAPVQTGLREVASPFLHDLHAATRATVHLAVREGDAVLYLDRLSGHASVPVVSKLGSTLPLHPTGVGKVLLAHAPGRVRARVLAGLRPITAHTVVQPGVLAAQLERVRRDGYATTVEEMTLGACSVAVPIRRGADAEAPVVAALGIVVPSLQRSKTRLVSALQVAARGISRSL
ncbi:IclR family transcriptional regulator [Tomitella gaofuii]|uniref:IclR family transcriptional regulator n=1 Tax=Tomitella gaofuii TaxID=2760083 RepID=UPI0015F9B515|nr:IclR family transcriptional regulator [Tomitella gaofuii]